MTAFRKAVIIAKFGVKIQIMPALSSKKQLPLTPIMRALLTLLLPPLIAIFVSLNAGNLGEINKPVFLGVVGLTSWFLGLYWYKLPGMGLRGKRPLYASIGFAVLGWIALLVVRFFVVASRDVAQGGLGRAFIFILLFEAFCVQIWAFGLIFRSVADWRGGLSAAFVSGVVFGVLGWLFFGETVADVSLSLPFFIVWGFFYGLIRLRAGTFVGMVVIHVMQTITTWHILLPASPSNLAQYGQFYLVNIIIFLIFIWRLWPKVESDYRV